MNPQSLSGFAAECKAQSLLKAAKCIPINFSTPELLSHLQNSEIGRQRLQKAEMHLLLEYGTQSSDGVTVLDWKTVPSDVLLDRALATDLAISYKGWNFSLDVTTDVEAIDFKVRKARSLFPVLSGLGFDFHITILMEDRFTTEDLKRGLDSVIQAYRKNKNLRCHSITLP